MEGYKPYTEKDFIPEGLRREPTILVVDDDPDVCKLLSFYLKRSGCNVLVASDGPQALEAIKKAPFVDLVLLDLRMPGMDGIETLRRINSLKKAGSVIMMTAYGTMKEAITTLKEGAYDFVKKTQGFDDLRLAIRNALQTVGLREEVEHLKAKLGEQENLYPEIVSRSDAMHQVKKLIRKITNRNITVLIEGESGSGKELVARAIHHNGDYRDKPYVAINCAAIPENLLESELFGYERGAFTGATTRRVGKFEEADGGTLFLDEIGELGMGLQAKLLRVLQTKEIEPLGGRTRKVNIRIISATNQRLGDSVRKGTFRQDLYYRLAVFPVLLPPLRERTDDILLLAGFFLKDFAKQEGSNVTRLSPDVEQALLGYDWPGNVRELENMIFRAVVLAESSTLELNDFPVLSVASASAPPPAPARNTPVDPDSNGAVSLNEAEARAIREALRSTAGNVSRAAGRLGISRATLYRKSKKFQIELR